MTKVLLIAAFGLFAVQVAIAEPSADAMVPQVENYFNHLSTFQARFTQLDTAQGLVQTGVFYLQRPNRFLWQYEQPQRQKVVSTGSRMFYVDEESEQVTQLPLNSGLAAILTQKNMDLTATDLTLVQAEKTAEGFQITLALPQEDGLSTGTVTLGFAENPRRLNQVHTRTALGQETLIDFYDVVQDSPLEAGLFNYIPPQEEIQFIN